MKHLTYVTAVSLLISLAFATSALADMKGGERLITLNAPKASVASSAPAAAKMSCPTEMRTSLDLSARGANKTATVFTMHACGSCQTKEVSTGVGKQATHTMEHSCQQAAICCGGK